MRTNRRTTLVLAAVTAFALLVGGVYLAAQRRGQPRAVHHQAEQALFAHQNPARVALSCRGPAPAGLRLAAEQDPRWQELHTAAGVPPYADLSDRNARADIVATLTRSERLQQVAVRKLQAQRGWPYRYESDGVLYELMGLNHGQPVMFQTFNAHAAISTAADLVRQTAPYNLDGSGVTAGVWDGGGIRTTHQEFGGRVTIMDGAGISDHPTHVGGTIGASGVISPAKGMAPAVTIHSYQWSSDQSEVYAVAMATPGQPDTIQISNHSYGNAAGWGSPPTGLSGVAWWGIWGDRESNLFGTYGVRPMTWDAICYSAPYYLLFKSAGNDRNDGAPSGSFWYFDDGWKSKSYNASTDPYSDGWDNGGFDTIPDSGNAKNIMTVGAVDDARSAGGGAMSSFSGWGPTDDGRIKPDIVANGVDLTSAMAGSDSAYGLKSGTSMSSPNAAGSAVLLVECYRELFEGYIRNNTLKGLIIHTADDMGNSGPDYSYGWGLMNTKAAADIMRQQALFPEANILCEGVLGGTNTEDTISFLWDESSSLKVTICWTDPPGYLQWGTDVRTPNLINDLDLRVTAPGGGVFFPYVLDGLNPTFFAARGDNHLDNVEQVVISTPPTTGVYTVSISYKDTLFSDSQHYAVWISGGSVMPEIGHTPLANTTETNTPYTVEASVRSMNTLDTNSFCVCWNTNGSTTVFTSNVLSLVSNNVCQSTLPAQALGTTISYCLRAATENGWVVRSPANAPLALHSFQITSPMVLVVTNSPASYGSVSPDYGSHTFPSGLTVTATASLLADETGDSRWRSAGWNGTGDVPASGTSNGVVFVLNQPSQLEWAWRKQWALHQTSSVPDLWSATSWWDAASPVQTETAPTLLARGGTDYRFVEWQVAGMRQPDATNTAVNPASAGLMTTSQLVTAVYLPEDEDADGDGLADWWERFFCGSTNAAPAGDEDADGVANTNEFLDGSDPKDGGSIPIAPVILHTALNSPQTRPAPWRISATVSDNFALASVELNWRRNAGGWQSVAMGAENGDVFTNMIPVPGLAGDSIDYYIRATDESGISSSNGVHSVVVTYPESAVGPTNLFFTMLAGTGTNAWLSVTNWGTTNLSWTVQERIAHLNDHVEFGTNAWQHGGVNDLWHISTRRALSGGHAWYCGKTSGGYANSMHATLDTPPLQLGSNAVLTFQHWMEAELGFGIYTYDGGIVEISTNKGVSFAQIEPQGGYPYFIYPHAESPWAGVVGCYAASEGWEPATFDLAEYAGCTVQLRFHFGSDGASVEEGWYVDDVSVVSVLPTNDWLRVTPRQGTTPSATAHGILLEVDTSSIVPGDDPVGVLQVMSNDPLTPTNNVTITVRPRSIPEVRISASAQTSRDGTGWVTISNQVSDVDREDNSLELMVSTNDGASWIVASVVDVSASVGVAAYSNGPPQVHSVQTADGYYRATNLVDVVWGSMNSMASMMVTNTLVRVRAWDGTYWSASVTSQPFVVDNEAPTVLPSLSVSSHTQATWSSNRVIQAHWSPASDGQGVGVAGYGVLFADSIAVAPMSVTTSGLTMASVPVIDGSNWWVAVRAVDAYGNAGADTDSGPYWIDASAPSATSAVVSVQTSASGDYVVGTTVTNSWSGFTDAMSGVSGYYFATSNAAPSDKGMWTTGVTGVVTFAPAMLDATHAVYVWARDNVGRIGMAAAADVLLLDPAEDYDQDGHTTTEEGITGTDASARESVLRFIAVASTATTNGPFVTVSWPSVIGRTYDLCERLALTNGVWSQVAGHTNLAGTGGTMVRTNELMDADARFYRVGVTLP